tara:strand:+ start:3134 stop:3331 length:198 start_codon:yes stop_codon:yes gene_type:complete
MSIFSKLGDDIVNDVFSDELQQEIVKALNDNIDIPFVSEATEEKALNALWDTIEGVLKTAIKKAL